MIDYEEAKRTKELWEKIQKENKESNFTERWLLATAAFNQLINK